MFTSRHKDRRTLQIEAQIQQRHELIQYKEIFTYKRLEESEEFFSKYISEHKKNISAYKQRIIRQPVFILGHDSVNNEIITSMGKISKNEFRQAMISSSILPELILGYDCANKAKNIISDVRKKGQTELESVIKSLKEIKEVAAYHEKQGSKLAEKRQMLFKSSLKNYFKKIFEKFNISNDDENEFAKIERLIDYEKEELIYQRISLTP